jgi:hypothetical protein
LVVVQLLMVLLWKETEVGGSATSKSSSIKLDWGSPDQGGQIGRLLFFGQQGGGREGKHRPAAALCRSAELLEWCCDDELNHAIGTLASAIFYRHGGVSSTFDAESLLRIRRWSSTLLRL